MALFSLFGDAYPLYGGPSQESRSYRSFQRGMFSMSLFSILGLAAVLFVAFGIALILEIVWYRRHNIIQEGVPHPIQSLVLRYLGFWVVATLVIGLGGNLLFYLIAFSFGGIHL